MGIDNLNGLLREKCPHVFVNRPLTEFVGKAVAIDANNWYFRLMSVHHRRTVDSTDITTGEPNRETTVQACNASAFDSICTFLSYGITPIFVFDGKHPASKLKTQQDRRSKREEAQQRLDELRKELANVDILARDGKRVDEMRKLLYQCNYVSASEFEYFRGLLRSVGIPCLQAEEEAEKYCSYLCYKGMVAAVVSHDTDNLAYGCPRVIMEFTDATYDRATNSKIHTVRTVGIMDVLTGLKLSYASFVDLCIMLGCDYNKNIPLIGATRAYAIIQKFGSIDRIPRMPNNPSLIRPEACECRLPKTREYDVTILNVDECRSLFRYQGSEMKACVFPEDKRNQTVPQDEPTLEIKKTLPENARDALNIAGLSRYITRLAGFYRQLPSPTPCPVTPIPTEEAPQVLVLSSDTRPNKIVTPRLVIVTDPVEEDRPSNTLFDEVTIAAPTRTSNRLLVLS